MSVQKAGAEQGLTTGSRYRDGLLHSIPNDTRKIAGDFHFAVVGQAYRDRLSLRETETLYSFHRQQKRAGEPGVHLKFHAFRLTIRPAHFQQHKEATARVYYANDHS